MAEARIDRHSAVIEHDLPDIYSFIAERDLAAARQRQFQSKSCR